MESWQPPIDFDALSASIYAQGAEEDMIARVFERIGTTNRFCVELGASDGLRNSNTALLLREHGWKGLFVEGAGHRFERLRANWESAENARLVGAMVQPDNVEAILDEADVPPEPDLMSIDIDGNDYWVWRAIERFRPRLLIVEYNPYYEPPTLWVMKFDPEHVWDGSTYYGASLESLCRLGKDKGYELIACDRQGNNAFFVPQSSFERFGIADNSSQALYRPAMYKVRFIGKNTFITGHPYRYGPGEEI